MTGPRVFEVEEVDSLLPRVEEAFRSLDGLKRQLKTLHIRINALEMIWGAAVHDDDNPDHEEFDHHVSEMQRIQQEFERKTRSIVELGGHVKSVDPALVDFYGVRDGHLVFWCWTRGEKRITHWHHIDEGFAGRQPF